MLQLKTPWYPIIPILFIVNSYNKSRLLKALEQLYILTV